MKNLHIIGVTHKTADIEFRDKLQVDPYFIPIILHQLKKKQLIEEGLLLCTCNRYELSFTSNKVQAVLEWLGQYHDLEVEYLSENLEVWHGKEAIKHIIKVTSGLESRIFGEAHISGQMKQAYHYAEATQTIGQIFRQIYQHSFHVSKIVQGQLSLPVNSIIQCFNIALLNHYPEITHEKALIIGTGKLARDTMLLLKQKKVQEIYIASHSPELAKKRYPHLSDHIIAIDKVHEYLNSVEIVFSATNTDEPLVSEKHINYINTDHKMLIADVSLPRSFSNAIKLLPAITYYNVDDLAELAGENKDSYCNLESKIEEFIEKETHYIQDKLDYMAMFKLIEPHRQAIKTYINEQLAAAKNEINHQVPIEKVIDHITKELSGTLLHACTLFLRQACRDHDLEGIDYFEHFIEKHRHHELLSDNLSRKSS